MNMRINYGLMTTSYERIKNPLTMFQHNQRIIQTQSLRFHKRNARVTAMLLNGHIIDAEGCRQRHIRRRAELNAHGLTGEACQAERPSQHVNSRCAFVEITERRKRRKQGARGVAHFDKDSVELRRRRGFARRDIEPETQVLAATSRNGDLLIFRMALVIAATENAVGHAAVWESAG